MLVLSPGCIRNLLCLHLLLSNTWPLYGWYHKRCNIFKWFYCSLSLSVSFFLRFTSTFTRGRNFATLTPGSMFCKFVFILLAYLGKSQPVGFSQRGDLLSFLVDICRVLHSFLDSFSQNFRVIPGLVTHPSSPTCQQLTPTSFAWLLRADCCVFRVFVSRVLFQLNSFFAVICEQTNHSATQSPTPLTKLNLFTFENCWSFTLLSESDFISLLNLLKNFKKIKTTTTKKQLSLQNVTTETVGSFMLVQRGKPMTWQN